MDPINFTITDPRAIRANAGNPMIERAELYPAKPDGHKFKVGETRTLQGLKSFPEYNGDAVTITAIRDNANGERAYYVRGRINEILNWVYENRLI